ncbi:general transcription factor 3C polypeptide 5-like isoform X2 [Halichondria panicea]|uniref:general transcription factor 3C polypeptide 5-like isoform X2 n=1 Tax=Halichondria panicea TaxID=6063 RepID=UPI00312B4B68
MQEEARDDRVFASIVEQRKLFCVELPAIVENEDRAISCLGGINAISKAHSESGAALEMRFRPEDRYCKPALAREDKVTNLVLRVRRRRRQGESNGRGMADYQVLSPGLNGSVPHTHPADFQLANPLEDGFTDRQLPTFFPPASFSKFDKPFNYLTPKTAVLVGVEEGSATEPAPLKQRPKRVHNIYGYMCNYKGMIPREPHPQAYGLPFADHPKIQELKDLLEERPLWTRTALQHRVKLKETFLRCLLSVLCYKFLSMPFKNLWVRLGYDPRSDPSSKQYQAIDYRVPQDLMGMVPESSRKGGYRGLDSGSQRVGGEDSGRGPEGGLEETAFTFLPNKFPTQRQLIYQLCDIKDPEVQQLVHCNDEQEPHFEEPNGWCETDTYDKIRRLLNTRLRAISNTPAKEAAPVAVKCDSKRKKTRSKQK